MSGEQKRLIISIKKPPLPEIIIRKKPFAEFAEDGTIPSLTDGIITKEKPPADIIIQKIPSAEDVPIPEDVPIRMRTAHSPAPVTSAKTSVNLCLLPVPASPPATEPVTSAETSITLRLKPRVGALEKRLIDADAEGRYGELGSQIRMDWGSITVVGDQRNQVPEFENTVRSVFAEMGYTVTSAHTEGSSVNESVIAPITLSLKAENTDTKLVNRMANGSPCKYFVTCSLTVTYHPEDDVTSIRGDVIMWPSAVN